MSEGDRRVALVTGANRGIGLEVVRQLAGDGFTAILGARDLDRGSSAAEPLRAEGLEVEAVSSTYPTRPAWRSSAPRSSATTAGWTCS